MQKQFPLYIPLLILVDNFFDLDHYTIAEPFICAVEGDR